MSKRCCLAVAKPMPFVLASHMKVQIASSVSLGFTALITITIITVIIVAITVIITIIVITVIIAITITIISVIVIVDKGRKKGNRSGLVYGMVWYGMERYGVYRSAQQYYYCCLF